MPARAPLRILQAFQPPDGGVPQHVLLVSEGLLARGHEVLVAGPPDAGVRAALEAAGASYEPLALAGGMTALRTDIVALRALSRLLRQHRMDLVHVHGQKAGILGRVAAQRARVPALYSPHCYVYRTQALRPRWSAGLRYRASLALERALGKRSAAIVAVCEEERDATVDDGVAPPERVHVVLNGVAPDHSIAPDPRLREFRGEGPLFGIVAALRESKGIPTLLEALELLSRRGHPVRFAIVGNGPLEDEVRRRVASPALAPTTTFEPFAGRVEPYLAALDVFVLPSLWEGLPIAALEAMALGLPVVASAVGGTPEAVTDGQTGLLFATGDAVALAERLERLAGDVDLRVRMGAQAQADAERSFSAPRMVDELEALYERVRLESRGAR